MDRPVTKKKSGAELETRLWISTKSFTVTKLTDNFVVITLFPISTNIIPMLLISTCYTPKEGKFKTSITNREIKVPRGLTE